MNLSDFQFLKEDAESYHVKHPEGKSLVVNKKGLSEKAHEVIKKLPRFSEGTQDPNIFSSANASDVSGNPISVGAGATEAPPSFLDAPDKSVFANAGQGRATQIQNLLSDEKNYPKGSPQEQGLVDELLKINPDAVPLPGTAAPQAPVTETPAETLAPASTAAPTAPDPLVQNRMDANSLLDKQQQDVKDYLGATGKAEGIAGKAYQDFLKKLEGMSSANDIVAASKQADDDLRKDYVDRKIDPDRYYNNQMTGSKILAGIGLILGGAGAHATGGRNLALDQMNRAIDLDIESQKNDQSKAMNLWKMNREALGTDVAANLATQNQMLSGVQAKAQIAAVASNSAQGKLRGNMLIDQLEQQKQQNRLKLGLLTQTSGTGQSGTLQADPAVLVPQLVPAEHQKQALTEIGQAQNAAANETSLMGAFHKLESENSVLGRVGRLGFEPPSSKAFDALVDPLIHDNEGRINELEQKHVQALKPQPGDMQATVLQKAAALQSFIEHKKSAPTAKAFGIDLSHFASTAGAPPTSEIKTMNGVPYQKIAGGWQRVQNGR